METAGPATPGCPDRATWLAVIDDRIAGARRDELLGHLRGCPACTRTVDGLAAGWSLADMARGNAAGPATLEFAARLGDTDPAAQDDGSAAPPAEPAIPGFRDLVLVGRGGMGEVYRATDPALERPVALKVLSGSRTLSPSARLQERYPSAADLAADLDRFLDGLPIRARRPKLIERVAVWARRRPTRAGALAVASLALLAGAAAGAYHVRQRQAAAEVIAANRARAVDAAARARAAMERLTDESAERLVVRGQPLDATDHEHLVRLRDEYRAWPLDPDEAEARRFRIRGLRRVAMLFDRVGRPDELMATLDATQAEIDAAEQRGLLAPAEEGLRYELARGERSRLMRAGRMAEARSRDEITRLEARVAVEPGLAPHLAGACGDLAAILGGQGRHDEAREMFRRAIALFDALAADPGAVAVPAHLEFSIRYNATISQALGRDPASRDALAARLVERGEAVLATQPPDASDRSAAVKGMLFGLQLRADAARSRGELPVAIEWLDRLQITARSLAASDPADGSVTDNAVAAACQAGECHHALGKPEAAVPALDEAVALATAAAAAQSAPFTCSRSLGLALDRRAQAARALHDSDGALARWRRIVEVMRPWISGAGVGEEARRIAADALVNAAAVLADVGQGAEGVAALEQAGQLAPAERQAAIEAMIKELTLAVATQSADRSPADATGQ